MPLPNDNLVALQTIEDVTRRQFMFGALGAALIIACGDDEESNVASFDDGFPITVQHQYGETVIPAPPQRVVSYGLHEQDWLLALGINPIAMRGWWGGHPFDTTPWSQDALLAAAPTVIAGEGDIELVASLAPDLIISTYSSVTADEYGLLSQVAPTVTRTDGYINFGMPWDEELRLIAKALGKEDVAEEVIESIMQRFTAYREAHPEWEGLTAAMATSTGAGTVRVRAPQDSMNGILQNLGFVIPEEFGRLAGESYVVDLSEEHARLLDVDLLIDYGDPPLGEDSVFHLLSVVQDGRVVILGPGLVDGMQFNSPLSIPFVLDRIIPYLEEATAKLT